MKAPHVLLLTVLAASLSGCATVIAGGPPEIRVESEPAGATVTLQNGAVLGTTPLTTYLQPGDWILQFQLDGHRSQRATVGRKLDSVSWLNTICLLCWAVDLASGEMWTIDPDAVRVALVPGSDPAPQVDPGNAVVAAITGNAPASVPAAEPMRAPGAATQPDRTAPPPAPIPANASTVPGTVGWGAYAQLVGHKWLYRDPSGTAIVTEYLWASPGATMITRSRALGDDYYVMYQGMRLDASGRIHVENYTNSPDPDMDGLFGRYVHQAGPGGRIDVTGPVGPNRFDLPSTRYQIDIRFPAPNEATWTYMQDGRQRVDRTLRITAADEERLEAAYRAEQARIDDENSWWNFFSDLLSVANTALTIHEVVTDPTGQAYRNFVTQHAPELAGLADVVGTAMTGSSPSAGNAASGGTAGANANCPTGGTGPCPDVLAGQAACRGYTVDNYQARFEQNASGPDVQLHTLCAGAYNYYAMYLNALRQGSSASEAYRTYEAYLGSVAVVRQFYAQTRTN